MDEIMNEVVTEEVKEAMEVAKKTSNPKAKMIAIGVVGVVVVAGTVGVIIWHKKGKKKEEPAPELHEVTPENVESDPENK